MSGKLKVPTYTWKVMDALTRADDLLTAPMVARIAGIDSKHALVALHNLKYCKAVDFVESSNTLWWFATPEDDTRSFARDERSPETGPRKRCPRKRVMTKRKRGDRPW